MFLNLEDKKMACNILKKDYWTILRISLKISSVLQIYHQHSKKIPLIEGSALPVQYIELKIEKLKCALHLTAILPFRENCKILEPYKHVSNLCSFFVYQLLNEI